MHFQKYWTKEHICAFIVLKAKTEKYKTNTKKLVYELWRKKMHTFFSSHFSVVLALKQYTQNCSFGQYFWLHNKKSYSSPKMAKMAFWWLIAFLVHFQNYQSKEHLCIYCFKSDSKQKREEHFFRGFSSKTKNTLVQWSKIVVFKAQIPIFFAFVLYFKRKLHANFLQKNINI